MASIEASLNAVPEIRLFSALTTKDYESLNKGEKAVIRVNEKQLLNKVFIKDIPEWFWGSQKSYRSCLSRRMELGVRQIIGDFLTI